MFNNKTTTLIKSLDTICHSESKDNRLTTMKSRKIFSIALIVTLSSVFLTMTIGEGQTATNEVIHSTGSVPTGTARLLFQSSFEEPPYIAGTSEWYLGNFATATYISLQNGGAVWVENSATPTPGAPTPHSGAHCIGLSSPPGAGTSLRAELQITHLDGTAGMGGIHGLNLVNEGFCSVWLYLPSDWEITGTAIDYWWYELVNCYVTGGGGGYPRVCIHIHRPNGVYNLQIEYNTGAGQGQVIGEINPFTVPLGEWFNLQWWLNRKSAADGGRFKFWIKTSIYDQYFDSITNFPNGIDTLGSSYYAMSIAKTYLNNQAGAPEHKIWVDDLEIWDGLP
jgi:hypothetical protein